jgi:ABC-2 type transport system ATP-binding protein
MSWFKRRGKLREMLEFVELRDHKNKQARDISGGMQRRLSLASTLIHDPELIFLDEPTAGIDPVLRSKFWDRFRELRDNGRTLFVTTQYVSEAAYCDLVGVMSNSRLIAVDTPEGLRHRAFGGDVVEMTTTERMDFRQESEMLRLPVIVGKVTRTGPQSLRMVVDEASTAIPTLMNWGQENNVEVQSIEQFQPPFDDVFVELMREEEQRE